MLENDGQTERSNRTPKRMRGTGAPQANAEFTFGFDFVYLMVPIWIGVSYVLI